MLLDDKKNNNNNDGVNDRLRSKNSTIWVLNHDVFTSQIWNYEDRKVE